MFAILFLDYTLKLLEYVVCGYRLLFFVPQLLEIFDR
jgi:hypothetical protein